MSKTPSLLTIRQFSERHPAFSEASLRWLRFNERSNGFARAFVTVGRRVLVDEMEFFRVVREQNSSTEPKAPETEGTAAHQGPFGWAEDDSSAAKSQPAAANE